MQDLLCLYDGPSLYDGKRIRAYTYPHYNTKVGTCLGLVVAPAEAISYSAVRRAGDDYSVCGSCPKRSKAAGGDGKCYVGNGTRVGMSLYHVLESGVAAPLSSVAALSEQLTRLDVKQFRSAIWGDVAAIPAEWWLEVDDVLLQHGVATLGYTHGQKTLPIEQLIHLQRSHVLSLDGTTTTDNLDQYAAMGWRWFRNAPPGNRPIPGLEFSCPASHERGQKTTCATCVACGSVGNQQGRRSAIIWAHDSSNLSITRKYLRSSQMRLQLAPEWL